MLKLKQKSRGKKRYYVAWFLSLSCLIAGGILYRYFVNFIATTTINLPLPLSVFPFEIKDWKGEDSEIPTTIREYMEKNFADDYISRRYINSEIQAWADIYLVYCASRPGSILGHRPRVCYPGNGWVHDSTDKSDFLTEQGRKVNCLIHRFHKPAPSYSEIVVLNFYIVNGKISTDEKEFSGFSGRFFNLTKNPARYVTQIQISSITENNIRKAAIDMTESMLKLMPDERGGISAVKNIDL